MMTSIDLRQVWILTRYALLSEWRMASMRSVGRGRKMSRGWAYWQIVIFLVLSGATVRLFVSNATGEAFVTAEAIFILYVSIIIASNIFMSFGSGFLSPDEARIISLQPVSSDTFFFSRLTVLICYTTAISLLIAIGPFIALQFFLREGIWFVLLAQNLLFVISIVLSGIASSMAIVVIYGILLGRLPTSSVAKITGYVQFLGTFVTALSFILLSQVERRIDLHSITLGTTPWIAAIPAYWFASLGALANGISSSLPILLALAGLIFLAVLSAASHILLGNKYQSEIEELSASASMTAKEKKSKPDSFVFRLYMQFARSDEARAIFQVMRAQFRYDPKFRMQLLSSLPPTFLYLLIAVIRGGIVDPFGGDWKRIAGANMFYLVAMVMPLITIQAISQSENYRAAWIFFSTPVDRAKLLLAIRNMLLVSVIGPYMLLITIIFSYYIPVFHAIENTLVLAGLAALIFQLYLVIVPKMPFAQPRRPNRGGFMMMAGITLFAILPMILFALVIYFGYQSQGRFWPMVAIVFTISAALEGAVHTRIRKKLEREEFEM